LDVCPPKTSTRRYAVQPCPQQTVLATVNEQISRRQHVWASPGNARGNAVCGPGTTKCNARSTGERVRQYTRDAFVVVRNDIQKGERAERMTPEQYRHTRHERTWRMSPDAVTNAKNCFNARSNNANVGLPATGPAVCPEQTGDAGQPHRQHVLFK